MSEVDLVRNRRAAACGRYCTCCATSATARLVARLIAGSFFSAGLTVAVETPSTAATSFIVTRSLTGSSSCSSWSGARIAACRGPFGRAATRMRAPVKLRLSELHGLVNRLQVKRLQHPKQHRQPLNAISLYQPDIHRVCHL